jgi:hypothetical protein
LTSIGHDPVRSGSRGSAGESYPAWAIIGYAQRNGIANGTCPRDAPAVGEWKLSDARGFVV